eukprot:1391327-Amphidinium_carterae.1
MLLQVVQPHGLVHGGFAYKCHGRCKVSAGWDSVICRHMCLCHGSCANTFLMVPATQQQRIWTRRVNASDAHTSSLKSPCGVIPDSRQSTCCQEVHA